MSYIRSVFLPLFCLLSVTIPTKRVISQILLKGTVYDSTKLYSITGVRVQATNGKFTYTDSAGLYKINVSEKDSVSFYYAGRSTTQFAVSSMTNYTQFDISLKVRTKEHYKTLKEIRVFSNTHKQDSLDNRQDFAKIFNYSNPTIRTETPSLGGAAGFDLDEIIHIFRFRKNKQNLRFQKFMIAEEEDKYVNYRFSSLLIKQLTGLKGDSLSSYKKLYRPSYEYVSHISQLDFYQYILASVAAFRKEVNIKD